MATRLVWPAALAAALAISAVVAGGAWWASAGDRAPTSTPPTAAGLSVYRDPVTGELGVPPPGAIPPPLVAAPSEALRAPGAARAEEPGASPGGGWKLGQGPVLQTMTAVMGPDGRVRVDCLPTPTD